MSLRRFTARDNNKSQPCIFNSDNLVTILDNKPDIALGVSIKGISWRHGLGVDLWIDDEDDLKDIPVVAGDAFKDGKGGRVLLAFLGGGVFSGDDSACLDCFSGDEYDSYLTVGLQDHTSSLISWLYWD